MKKRIALIVIAGGMFLLLQASRPEPGLIAQIPEEVSTILESHCYDCHITESNVFLAKKAVNFSEWEEYRVSKQVSALGNIHKMIEKGKMPPKKYLKNNPDKKLSESQEQIILDWTTEASEKLLGEN